MEISKFTTLLPILVGGAVVALVIPLSISLLLGGSLTAVPAALGGGGGGTEWGAVGFLFGFVVVLGFGLRKSWSYLFDGAPESRR